MIANDLPGSIRHIAKVTNLLVANLAPENGAVTYLKALDVSFSNSESGGQLTTFSLSRHADSDVSDFDTILAYARQASLVSSYATRSPDEISGYDPEIDYLDEHDLSLLYPNAKKSSEPQGWYKDATYDDYYEL